MQAVCTRLSVLSIIIPHDCMLYVQLENRTGMQEVYDVYAAQQPLEEGEEKHIISVFVADESGIINRVAGVFARRGVPWPKHPGLTADSDQGFIVPVSHDKSRPFPVDRQTCS